MSNEDPGKKCCLAICSGIHFCLALIAGIILGLRWSNTHAIAEANTTAGGFYDQLPAYYFYNASDEYYGSNADTASLYFFSIEEDCGEYNETDECWS